MWLTSAIIAESGITRVCEGATLSTVQYAVSLMMESASGLASPMLDRSSSATALDVVLADTIHPSLDMTSFEIRGTSHPCIVTLGPGHIVHFRFDGIMLPDSTTNFLTSTRSGAIWGAGDDWACHGARTD